MKDAEKQKIIRELAIWGLVAINGEIIDNTKHTIKAIVEKDKATREVVEADLWDAVRMTKMLFRHRKRLAPLVGLSAQDFEAYLTSEITK